MWTKQIEKYKDKSSFIKINSPSNEKEIVAAEKELNVAFPNELRELLLELNGDGILLHSVQQIIVYWWQWLWRLLLLYHYKWNNCVK